MSARTRVLLIAVAVVTSLNAAVWAIERVSGGPTVEGPISSSYVTDDSGTGAFADLLVSQGHVVQRLRVPPSEAGLDPATTLVLLDAGAPDEGDAEAVASFVDAGGRLVVGGAGAPGWVAEIFDPPSEGGGFLDSARPLIPVAEVRGVTEVRAGIRRTWAVDGPALPVLGESDRVLLSIADRGRGRVLLMSDVAPLHNSQLAQADNAVLAVNLAGDPSRTVVFVESVHGFRVGQGFGAIPARWRWIALLLAGAALVWMASRARRIGPPSSGSRDLPPPRREYVEAVAATLARTGAPADAIEPVRTWVRRRIAGRDGYDPMAGDRPLRESARRIGLESDEIEAILGEGGSPGDVLAAGRALARLHHSD